MSEQNVEEVDSSYFRIDEYTQVARARELQSKHLGLRVLTAKPRSDLKVIGRLESFKMTADSGEGQVKSVVVRISGIKAELPADQTVFFVDGDNVKPVFT
ncbi:hypothetical protein [Arthrobacter sp. D5-1]|uniref:hypothetical protein n=1 Tax=Arthrobacter sp. D5-1 TaxID=1477518 RepID=UPI001A98A102|nr:hypothetical protein [Arthrobacter sp. D5-1]QSZ47216.1 hypothetical protein AYX22_01495 [Arthrobacter sp. D5-1]